MAHFPTFLDQEWGSSDNLAVDISVLLLADGVGVDAFIVGLDGRMWHSPQRRDGTFPDFAEHLSVSQRTVPYILPLSC